MLVPKQKAAGMPCLLQGQQMRQALELGLSEKLWDREVQTHWSLQCSMPSFLGQRASRGKWLNNTLLPKIGSKEVGEKTSSEVLAALCGSHSRPASFSTYPYWSTELLKPLTIHTKNSRQGLCFGLFSQTAPHSVALACLKLKILLPQPPEC